MGGCIVGSRITVAEVAEMAKVASKVYREVKEDCRFDATDIKYLCEKVCQLSGELTVSLDGPKEILYSAICRLYPNKFGRGAFAQEVVELAKTRYGEPEREL